MSADGRQKSHRNKSGCDNIFTYKKMNITTQSLFDVVNRAELLSKKGPCDESIDSIFVYFDSLLRASKFNLIDDFLNEIVVDNYSIDMLIGLLTITAPAESLLPQRNKVLESTRKIISERQVKERDLLFGL